MPQQRLFERPFVRSVQYSGTYGQCSRRTAEHTEKFAPPHASTPKADIGGLVVACPLSANTRHRRRVTSRVAQRLTARPAEVKLGGFSAPTQDVSGALGSARNDTMTVWAHGD